MTTGSEGQWGSIDRQIANFDVPRLLKPERRVPADMKALFDGCTLKPEAKPGLYICPFTYPWKLSVFHVTYPTHRTGQTWSSCCSDFFANDVKCAMPFISHFMFFINFFLIFQFFILDSIARIEYRVLYRVTSSRAIITLSNIRILAYWPYTDHHTVLSGVSTVRRRKFNYWWKNFQIPKSLP